MFPVCKPHIISLFKASGDDVVWPTMSHLPTKQALQWLVNLCRTFLFMCMDEILCPCVMPPLPFRQSSPSYLTGSKWMLDIQNKLTECPRVSFINILYARIGALKRCTLLPKQTVNHAFEHFGGKGIWRHRWWGGEFKPHGKMMHVKHLIQFNILIWINMAESHLYNLC